MARKLRIEYPGAVYHVMSRGDRGEAIFADDKDREALLGALAKTCARTGWHVLAWCWMVNHFHLVIETPRPNLVAGMKWLLGTYTGRFNRRHKFFGHLFSGRYKALVVDAGEPGYLKTVCDYVHLNPVRARLLKPEQKLAGYRWSSWRHYLAPPRKRPAWLRTHRLLGEHGIPRDSKEGRRELSRRMELQRAAEQAPGALKALQRGWCLGSDAFRQELLEQATKPMAEHNFGEERRLNEQAKAEEIIGARLSELGWKQKDLAARPKGDPQKVRLAARLRAETTVTVKWIAQRLEMGTWTYANHLLYWHSRKKNE